MKNLCFLLFFFLLWPFSISKAQTETPTPCTIPWVGPGRVVDSETSGLLSVVDGTNSIGNLTDGNLGNSTAITPLLSLEAATTVVSIRDLKQSHAGGLRAGFMITMNGGLLDGVLGEQGLLDVDLLSGLLDALQNNFQIRTYLNGVPANNSAGTLTVEPIDILAPTGMQKISFETTQPFDEIELVQTGIASAALSSVNIHYAFTEPAAGCPAAMEPILETNHFNATVEADWWNILNNDSGEEVVNEATDDKITITSGSVLMVKVSDVISVNTPVVIPAGSQVGFVIGTLDLSLIGGGVVIETLMDGEPTGDNNAGISVLGASLSSADTQTIGFTTDVPCNGIRIQGAPSVLGASAIDVYYAFAYIDSDNDGIYDPVDICAGDDKMDADGDGIPDACDTPLCTLNLGSDIILCENETSYDFSSLNLGTGLTWTVLSGSASVSNSGLVTGMDALGTYQIEVRNAEGCSDVITITKREALIETGCDVPIAGIDVEMFNPTGTCLLCLLDDNSENFDAVIDGDMSNYTEVTNLVSLLESDPVIGVRNMETVYPAGTRTGFVIQSLGGLLKADLLSSFKIATYLNGEFQEESTQSNLLLSATVLGGNGSLQRIGFETTKEFDAVVFYMNSGLSLLSGIRIYYAYQEPASCPVNGTNAADCNDILTLNSDYKATIGTENTGFGGVACIGCALIDLANMIDADETNYAIINQTLGALSSASVSVKSDVVIKGDSLSQVGYIIEQEIDLANLNTLQTMILTTYLDGVEKQSFTVGANLLGLQLLDGDSQKMEIGFTPKDDFNEIKLTINSLVSGLSPVNVYGVFVRQDTDRDGTPDCLDKCCAGPDYLDMDGDGIPDGCDTPPCTLNLGPDVTICAGDTSYDFSYLNLGTGLTWTVLEGSASVSNDSIIGMEALGTYEIEVRNDYGCSDTIVITKQDAVVEGEICNIPMVGDNVELYTPTENCVLCLLSGESENPMAAIDGDLSNYVEVTSSLLDVNVLSSDPLIGVRNLETTYPAGTRTGFVIQQVGGLLSTDLLSNLTIRTYLNGVVQDDVTMSAGLVSATVLGGEGNLQRIGITTTKEFDAVALYMNELIDVNLLSGGMRIYYAYQEPADCPANGANVSDCNDMMTRDSEYNAKINMNNSGFGGVACVGCTMADLNNITDADETNYASIYQLVSAGGTTSVSVVSDVIIKGGINKVGYVISSEANLLDATVIENITLHTYLEGVAVEDFSAGADLLGLRLLGGADNKMEIGFTPTKNFDEIQLSMGALAGVATTTKIYGVFLRTDSDGDGVPDCLDKCCAGPDYLDWDGDGIPDGCDTPPCTLNLGPDITLCANENSYNFTNLGTGLTWEILPGSPEGATISDGTVSGMDATGSYQVQVSNADGCSDVITILKRDALMDGICNIPIVGNDAEIFAPTGGVCILCLLEGESGNAESVIDGDLSNYIELTSFVSLLDFANPIIGVRDTVQVYPAGTQTGFAVQAIGGLISADLLSNFRIITYLDGVQQETSVENPLLLSAAVLGGGGSLQRIGIQTTKPFNGIALFSTSGIDLLTGLRIFYAYQEAADCPANSIGAAACNEMMTRDSGYEAKLNMERTGFTGLVNALSYISGIGNITDTDDTNYATIYQVAAVGSSASISVKSNVVIKGDSLSQAGFILSSETNLLDAEVLGSMTLKTYLNGELKETITSTSLVGLELLGAEDGKIEVSFTPEYDFDEFQLTITSLVSLLQEVNVYGAFVRQDSDRDGTPDCVDKCCLGPDNIDANGDGIPDACAIDVVYDASCVNCPVLVSLSGPGLSADKEYAIFNGDKKEGSFNEENKAQFNPTVSGITTYSLKSSTDNTTYHFLKSATVNVHPAQATWKTTASDASWSNGANWTPGDSGTGGYPIWCTDVTIPSTSINFPSLETGDQCRDIYFQSGGSVGNIVELKYRYAHVNLAVPRNEWVMVSAPLKYMYSGDYAADVSWGNARGSQSFMRYFDIDYLNSGKANPDNIAGSTVGYFSRAFANLESRLNPTAGYALWVNGAPYEVSEYFDETDEFEFPRRNEEGGEVQFSYHNTAGNWVGAPFYLSDIAERGNPIDYDSEWTETTIPDADNRYRFVFEELVDDKSTDKSFNVKVARGNLIMLGNPYMSHLDFNQFFESNSAGMLNYFRMWDMANGQFRSFIGQNVTAPSMEGLGGVSTDPADDPLASTNIPPMQSFFVETTAGTEDLSLVFNPALCVSNLPEMAPALRSSESKEGEFVRIQLNVGDKKGNAIVAVNENASDGYLPNEDIYKLFSSMVDAPQIYTIADKIAIEINLVNSQTNDHIIPIGIKTERVGKMEFEFSDLEKMVSYENIYLIDTRENIHYNLREVDKVEFVKTTSDDIEGRFYIQLNKVDTKIQDVSTSEIFAFCKDKTVKVSSPQEKIVEIQLYNSMGVMEQEIVDVNDNYLEFNANTDNGIYILTVKTENNTKSFKFIF